MMHGQIIHDFDRCTAVTGDYIAIARDFSLGVRSPSWAVIHEHMLKFRRGDLVYRRSSKSVSWAADFIFLDLPFGGLIAGYGISPMWDRITEDHVRAGIHLAWNTLSDSGWLIIMASFSGLWHFTTLKLSFGFINMLLITYVFICVSGDSLRWVERFSAASDMQIYRRIVVLHHTPYGFMERGGDRVEVNYIFIC